MKVVSDEHLQRMKLMCEVFEKQSKTYTDVLPQFEASKLINELILNLEHPEISDFKKIVNIIADVDKGQHSNGSQWHDYKIHVMATLRANGYKVVL